MKDVALLHVAAILDPDVKKERIQAWADNCNWNDILSIMRRLYPQHQFVDDLPNMTQLSITTDLTLPFGLLRKWGLQDAWKSLEQTVRDNVSPIAESQWKA